MFTFHFLPIEAVATEKEADLKKKSEQPWSKIKVQEK